MAADTLIRIKTGSGRRVRDATRRRANQLPGAKTCQVRGRKIFRFFRNKKRCMVHTVPPPHEGRIAIVTYVGSGMRWTLTCRTTNGPFRVRQSRVVLAPRRWRQVGVDVSQSTPMMGARKPGPQGEPGISRKAIAQGMPDCLRFTCMLVCIFF